MNQLRRIGLAAAAAALLAGPAFAQQSGSATMPETSGSGASASAAHGAADQAFMSGMQAMQRQMSDVRMTGKPDQDFVSMMIPHHQGAINMAKTELKYGKSAYLKHMARKIIASQSREIKEMKSWQAKHRSMQ